MRRHLIWEIQRDNFVAKLRFCKLLLRAEVSKYSGCICAYHKRDDCDELLLVR